MNKSDIDKIADCPVMVSIGVIGGKWKPRILWLLRSGPLRFSDLKRAIPDASEKMLAEHLRALESESIVVRRQFLEGAVIAAEYSYTEYGRTLIPALDALGAWGLQHEADRAQRAAALGNGAEALGREGIG
jgi:DNA-binding HxlR family transcriptional regulator